MLIAPFDITNKALKVRFSYVYGMYCCERLVVLMLSARFIKLQS